MGRWWNYIPYSEKAHTIIEEIKIASNYNLYINSLNIEVYGAKVMHKRQNISDQIDVYQIVQSDQSIRCKKNGEVMIKLK